MPPLPIFKDRAFLASPLETPVYILELHTTKDRLIEGEIRDQLKALYPGTPENTVVDYKICHRKKGIGARGPNHAAVFVSPASAYETYRNLRRPLIPGIALMEKALGSLGKVLGEGTALAVLITPEWIEAAFFEGAEIRRHRSRPLEADGLSDAFIAEFLPPNKSTEIPALLITVNAPEEPYLKAEKALAQLCSRVVPLDITNITIKEKLSSLGIFNDARGRSQKRRRRGIGALAALNCVSLLLSLHMVSAKTAEELSAMQVYRQERREKQDAAERLEKEIVELLSRNAGTDPESRGDPYGIIAQIQHCIAGGWIKSLTIQDRKFSLEAEGADSIGTLHALQESGHFSGLTLHQASSSSIAGEQFAISGKAVGHGEN
jgi:hypothetical protein